MASDAYIAEQAQAFLDRLNPENHALGDHTIQPRFIEDPVNETTVPFPQSGAPDAQATVYHPFLIIWRYLNAEVVAVATIGWGPDAPANDPRLRSRM